MKEKRQRVGKVFIKNGSFKVWNIRYKIGFISTFINLNIQWLLDLVLWWSHFVSPSWDLHFHLKICSLNLFSVSIWWFWRRRSNFTPSWACLAHLEHWWPHFSRLTFEACYCQDSLLQSRFAEHITFHCFALVTCLRRSCYICQK
jgi:hypothetical protein